MGSNERSHKLNTLTSCVHEFLQDLVYELVVSKCTLSNITTNAMVCIQVVEGVGEVNATFSQVQEVAEETERVAETATEMALGLKNRSHELMYQTGVNNDRSSANQQVKQ